MGRGGSVGDRGDRKGRRGIWVGVIAALWLCAAESSADWEVYVGAGLGISAADSGTNGARSGVALGGSDIDTSPMLDGTVGLAIPMDEIVPREWIGRGRLPDWPVRFEIEGAGFREYELRSSANTERFYTEIETATMFLNGWLDVPLITLWRPVQYLGGLGRQPRTRQWLDPGSLYFGVGIGMAALDVQGTSNVFTVRDEFIEFAWNAGLGIDYALTDNVDLSVGYRFLCFAGEKCMAHNDGLELPISGGTPATGDFDLKYELMSHELRVQIRVEVHDFLSPWR